MKVLACDLGGTRAKIGVVDGGRILAHTVQPVDAGQTLAGELTRLKSVWLDLLAGIGGRPADCAGISVAFPSLMDPRTGRILGDFGKYTDAPGLDLRRWARSELNLPLAIENDARMALLGEWLFGAGRGCDNLGMLTLGTGLGTAILLEGRLLRGCHGQAGVLGGHLTVRHDGLPCACGNVGCGEAEASTSVLDRLARTRPEYASSALRHAAPANYAQVIQFAAGGDPCARALLEHSLRVWGSVAVNLIHAYDLERLVIGGGIMAGAEVVLPALRTHVDRHAHTPWGRVELVAGTLGDHAALLSADWLLAGLLAQGDNSG